MKKIYNLMGNEPAFSSVQFQNNVKYDDSNFINEVNETQKFAIDRHMNRLHSIERKCVSK